MTTSTKNVHILDIEFLNTAQFDGTWKSVGITGSVSKAKHFMSKMIRTGNSTAQTTNYVDNFVDSVNNGKVSYDIIASGYVLQKILYPLSNGPFKKN